jgi:hypothetical protein
MNTTGTPFTINITYEDLINGLTDGRWNKVEKGASMDKHPFTPIERSRHSKCDRCNKHEGDPHHEGRLDLQNVGMALYAGWACSACGYRSWDIDWNYDPKGSLIATQMHHAGNKPYRVYS